MGGEKAPKVVLAPVGEALGRGEAAAAHAGSVAARWCCAARVVGLGWRHRASVPTKHKGVVVGWVVLLPAGWHPVGLDDAMRLWVPGGCWDGVPAPGSGREAQDGRGWADGWVRASRGMARLSTN